MCGIGGDLFILIHMAAKGTFDALNASGPAPAGATLEAYQVLCYPACARDGHSHLHRTGCYCRLGGRPQETRFPGFGHPAAQDSPMRETDFWFTRTWSMPSTNGRLSCRSPGPPESFFAGGGGGAIPRVGQLMVQPKLAQSYQMLMESYAEIMGSPRLS